MWNFKFRQIGESLWIYFRQFNFFLSLANGDRLLWTQRAVRLLCQNKHPYFSVYRANVLYYVPMALHVLISDIKFWIGTIIIFAGCIFMNECFRKLAWCQKIIKLWFSCNFDLRARSDCVAIQGALYVSAVVMTGQHVHGSGHGQQEPSQPVVPRGDQTEVSAASPQADRHRVCRPAEDHDGSSAEWWKRAWALLWNIIRLFLTFPK